MKQSELAAILAMTYVCSPDRPNEQHYRWQDQSDDRARRPNASTTRVPAFSTRPSPETSRSTPNRRRYRDCSARKTPKDTTTNANYRDSDRPCITSQRSISSLRTNGSTARPEPTSADEPEFILEERQAWSRGSPDAVGQGVGSPLRPSSRHSPSHQSFRSTHNPNFSRLVSHPAHQAESGEGATKTGQEQMTPFSPWQSTDAMLTRPRTRRGLQTTVDRGFTIGITKTDLNLGMPTRKSAFIEGTMNPTSRSTASSWDQAAGPALDFDLDVDSISDVSATTIESRDPSFDISELKPLPPTPRTLRGTLFRLGGRTKTENHQGASERSSIETVVPQTPRRGLRKSISNWNFVANKIKIFSGTPDAGKWEKANDKDVLLEKGILDERKRKAEEAYALQFGTKKKKDNFGLPTKISRIGMLETSTTRCWPHGCVPSSRPHSSYQRPSTRSSDVVPDSFSQVTFAATPSRTNSLGRKDRHMKPTRAELEKENQQLRAMLLESQCRNQPIIDRPISALSTHSNKSSIHLPLEDSSELMDEDASLNGLQPSRRPQSPAGADLGYHTHDIGIALSQPLSKNFKKVVHEDEDIPPVPALPVKIPHRNILCTVENMSRRSSTNERNNSKSSTRPSETKPQAERNTANDVTKNTSSGNIVHSTIHGVARLPRPLSMVMEGDEEMIGDENLCRKFRCDPVKEDKEWQWPDDVF